MSIRRRFDVANWENAMFMLRRRKVMVVRVNSRSLAPCQYHAGGVHHIPVRGDGTYRSELSAHTLQNGVLW